MRQAAAIDDGGWTGARSAPVAGDARLEATPRRDRELPSAPARGGSGFAALVSLAVHAAIVVAAALSLGAPQPTGEPNAIAVELVAASGEAPAAAAAPNAESTRAGPNLRNDAPPPRRQLGRTLRRRFRQTPPSRRAAKPTETSEAAIPAAAKSVDAAEASDAAPPAPLMRDPASEAHAGRRRAGAGFAAVAIGVRAARGRFRRRAGRPARRTESGRQAAGGARRRPPRAAGAAVRRARPDQRRGVSARRGRTRRLSQRAAGEDLGLGALSRAGARARRNRRRDGALRARRRRRGDARRSRPIERRSRARRRSLGGGAAGEPAACPAYRSATRLFGADPLRAAGCAGTSANLRSPTLS